MSARAALERIYREAISRGAHRYVDPATGYQVMTELAHLARGSCCGNGCRHCPYEHAKVAPELRVGLAAPVLAGAVLAGASLGTAPSGPEGGGESER